VLNRHLLSIVVVFSCLGGSVWSQSNQALIDTLVRKGILTQAEAEKLEAEYAKGAVVTIPASPITLSPWIKELKLSGDLRLRYQYDVEQRQEPLAATTSNSGRNHIAQRSRWRFRLRLNAEAKFDFGFFGGFSLTTNNASDSGNQTYTGAYRNYNIYINKAFLGWGGVPGLKIIAGKQDNPFYGTDMFWDPDIYPNGLVERIDFHKLFGWEASGEPAVGKETVTPPPSAPPKSAFELSLIAGQFIFYDNNEYNFDSDLKNDSYQFETQLLAKYKSNALSFSLAPGLFVTNAAAVGHDPAYLVTDTKVRPLVFGGANIGRREERDLLVGLLPGDITIKLGKLPLALYWDLAYNFDGGKRFNLLRAPGVNGDPAGAGPTGLFSQVNLSPTTGAVTGLRSPASGSARDRFAWLMGIKLGENKKAGDFSVQGDFRQIGIAAIDPNLTNDDFMNGRINAQGFGVGLTYNLTDFSWSAYKAGLTGS
jgi:Putative porin